MDSMKLNSLYLNGNREKLRMWLFRFIKFNAIGFAVFLIGTAIYAVLFGTLGAWSWVPSSAAGGILQFSIISFLNTKKKGKMFN